MTQDERAVIAQAAEYLAAAEPALAAITRSADAAPDVRQAARQTLTRLPTFRARLDALTGA